MYGRHYFPLSYFAVSYFPSAEQAASGAMSADLSGSGSMSATIEAAAAALTTGGGFGQRPRRIRERRVVPAPPIPAFAEANIIAPMSVSVSASLSATTAAASMITVRSSMKAVGSVDTFERDVFEVMMLLAA